MKTSNTIAHCQILMASLGVFIVPTISLTSSASESTPEPAFSNGVHITNHDTFPHIIEYLHNRISSSICTLDKPFAGIKNGLLPAFNRKPAGYTILSVSPVKPGPYTLVRAQIDAGANIYCLCTRACSISIDQDKPVSFQSGSYIRMNENNESHTEIHQQLDK